MSKKRILIVDDDPEFAFLTKVNLEGTEEYEVETVQQSALAVAEARRFKPDLILLDMVMPGVDGGDVAMEFKRDPFLRSTPVLFVTALVSEDDVSAGAAIITGDGLMLPKTMDPEMLVRHIGQQLAET